ncbi:S9 family peptidase [Sphingomonas sp. SM33]|uniref:S9 family peptidase n=1 Tax=Sphingomonas telluris TaxID=2907998 RepID=A0ABS9VLJ6_9SPHN|nr:S9 family peptidase [Sphingomonas telluris]MCH8615833.1 S9 family peptidase [Sphingomonas telluris]
MRTFTKLVLLASTMVAPSVAAAQSGDVPLIERAKLFGNPTKAIGRISPDGKWISYTQPRDGVMNVYVAPVGDPDNAKPLTNERERPVRSYFWSPDSKQILFIQDKGGDENFLLYGVDVATGKQTTLTPFTKTRAQLVGSSNKHKDRVLVGLNNRDAKWHDVYSLNLKTGKLTLVQKNDGYAGFLADNDLKLRMALKSRDDGGTDYYRITNGKIEAKPFATVGLDDSLTTSPAGFNADGSILYWIDSRGRNTAALIAQNVASGEQTVIGESPKADIGSVLTNPKTLAVEAYQAEYLTPEWTPVDKEIGATLDWLKYKLGATPVVQARTDADDKWIVTADKVTEPATVYLFDRKAGTLTKLYTGRPDLVGAPLVPMHPVEIKARDGLALPSYLTLPANADANRDGKPDHPVPMVLVVHGGPWGRDGYGYDPYSQWLANRGYAVLQVNFRASTGFGKDFLAAGNLQWGKKMQDDLTDSVAWAVSNGITTADKVAILGGSYGGYATLAGLTFTPETYACGVDIVGPSNLFTLLGTIPPYWESFKQQFYQRMGNPTTEDGKALLKAASPLTFADRIKKPLLIGQGANDPRVNKRESDQIVEAMKAKGIPVTYVLFPDEGHGFARPANNIAFNAVAENFLQTCLGGRAEPIGDGLKGSTIQVLQGADIVNGLKQSMASK